MHSQPIETTDRLLRLETDIEKLRDAIADTPRARQLFRGVRQHSVDGAAAYRAAGVAGRPAHFVDQLSIPVRKLRRAINGLVLLVQLAYLPIEDAREPIIEARALEQLVRKALNGARRRKVRRTPA